MVLHQLRVLIDKRGNMVGEWGVMVGKNYPALVISSGHAMLLQRDVFDRRENYVKKIVRKLHYSFYLFVILKFSIYFNNIFINYIINTIIFYTIHT